MPASNTSSAKQPDVSALIASLSRKDSGKLVSILTRIFGPHNLALAEDAVQDVMMKAMERWTTHGIPENPSAWLFSAARNRTIDIIRKTRREQQFAGDLSSLLDSEYSTAITIDECFRDEQIRDNQLKMMFACCNPSLSREGQIALIMKTICGFSVPQIARAFITTPDTVEKRLYRARIAFRENNDSLDIPTGKALQERLNNVLETIYLLFNEAHTASYAESLVRFDLAEECLRLCCMLAEYPLTALPATYALLALLCFHTARLHSRTDVNGDLILMKDQDRGLWDKPMIDKGVYFLNRAAEGKKLSRYHIEAAIAYEHCKAASYEETDWASILGFYDLLATIIPSPVVLLNRAIAIKELKGPEPALECIRAIPGIDYLKDYYLLHAVLGELYVAMEQPEKARSHYEKALNLCVSEPEKRLIRQKISNIK